MSGFLYPLFLHEKTLLFLIYDFIIIKKGTIMKPILICIAGGSASGKTTVVEEIQKKIRKDEAIFIRHDDYYRDQESMTLEERRKVNYDHPDSLEND